MSEPSKAAVEAAKKILRAIARAMLSKSYSLCEDDLLWCEPIVSSAIDAETSRLSADTERLDWFEEYFMPSFGQIIQKKHMSSLSPFKHSRSVREAIDSARGVTSGEVKGKDSGKETPRLPEQSEAEWTVDRGVRQDGF